MWVGGWVREQMPAGVSVRVSERMGGHTCSQQTSEPAGPSRLPNPPVCSSQNSAAHTPGPGSLHQMLGGLPLC